jgi:hypothetical protein
MLALMEPGERVEAFSLLLAPVVVVVGAYLLTRHGRNRIVRRIGFLTIAVLAAGVGAFGLAAYGILLAVLSVPAFVIAFRAALAAYDA